MPDHCRIANADRAVPSTTRRVLATAADFHDVGFFSFPAIFATVFAAFLRRAIACSMRALPSWFVSHKRPPQLFQASRIFNCWGMPCPHVKARRGQGQEEQPGQRRNRPNVDLFIFLIDDERCLRYPRSFFNRSAASRSVSSFLQKQNRTCCAPSAGSL